MKKIKATGLTEENKFLYFLLHLHMLSTHIENIMEALKDFAQSNLKERNANSFTILWSGLMELIILKYAAYYDEFHNHKSKIPDVELQRAIKKAFSKITNKWPDIDNYRNEIVAHSYRRGEESLFALPLETAYNIPETMADILLLTATVKIVTDLLHNRYANEFKMFENKKMMASRHQKTPLI
jgi:hypothetical protein